MAHSFNPPLPLDVPQRPAKLGAGLYSIGIPKDSVLRYETALKADHFVVVAHGTLDEMAAAKRILEKTKPLSIDEHHVSTATDGEFRQQGATVGSS